MSSTKKLSAEKYSAMPFFRFTLRHNLQHLALYMVIAVLLMLLPTVIVINEVSERSREYVEYFMDSVASDVEVIGGLGILVAGITALLAGMSTASYVNSKTGVGCFHSFPVRREVLLGCESLTRLIYFGVTFVFGYAVSYLVLMAALPSEGVAMGSRNYWLFALCAVIVFVVVYSLLLFAAGLTGSGVTRLLMAGLIVCLPAALYALVIAMAAMGCNDLYDNYYLNENMLKYIFLPVRGYYGIYDLIEYGRIGELLTTLIDTAFFTSGAFLLQKYRRSEDSGTSIIWKPVFIVVKLAVVIVCALFGGWFLSNAMGMDRSVSLIIGAVIGGVAAFIAVNCILYRSSRAMFKGLKSFGVVMACVIVFLFFVPMNSFDLIGKFYSPAFTDEFVVKLSQYGTELTFDEPEEVKLVYSLITDDESMYSGDTYLDVPLFDMHKHPVVKKLDIEYNANSDYSSKYERSALANGVYISDHDYGINTCSVIVVQKPKIGIPLAMRVYSDLNSVFLDEITASEEFAYQMNAAERISYEKILEAEIWLDDRSVSFYDHTAGDGDVILNRGSVSYGKDRETFNTMESIEEYFADVLANASYDNAYRETSPVVGRITLCCEADGHMETSPTGTQWNISLPIYAHDIDLLNAAEYAIERAYAEVNRAALDYNPIDSAEEYYERALGLADERSVILLVNCRTGEYAEIDEETLLGLADQTTAFISSVTYASEQFELMSTSDYMILCGMEEESDIQIRFRRGTDMDETLAALMKNK